MKRIFSICLILLSLFAGFYFGRMIGMNHALTSDGWIEGDKFVLEVDGDLYEWDINLR